MKVSISETERLKQDAPVLGAVERSRGGHRRFWVYFPHCKVEHVHGPVEGRREAIAWIRAARRLGQPVND